VPERFVRRHPRPRDRFSCSERPAPGEPAYHYTPPQKTAPSFPLKSPEPLRSRRRNAPCSCGVVDISGAQGKRKPACDASGGFKRTWRGLRTVGQMFSELAHEINQPRAAAANYARACVTFAKSKEGLTQEQFFWSTGMEKTAPKRPGPSTS